MKLTQQIQLFKSVSPAEIMLFTRHLATMIRAGIPLVDALETLQEQVKKPFFKQTLVEITQKVENGSSLADAMAAHPGAFSPFYVSLIGMSEKSGTLDENLDFISQQLVKNYQLKAKIKNAFLYPSIVLVSAVIMGTFITLFVLPQLVGFFSVMTVELPASTKVLVFIATVAQSHGVAIIIGIAFCAWLFALFVRMRAIKPYWHAFLLRIPLFGTFLCITQLAQVTRNLGILLKTGLPITDALSITSKTLSNESYRRSLETVATAINAGSDMAKTLDSLESHLYPTLVTKMIAVGEKTGNLDESLLYLADFYEDEIDTTTKNLTTLLEPALLLVIGLVVGFIALAIITPIYELSGSIRT